MGVEQIREVLEIYLITGGMSILVLKSKKVAPLTTISKYFQKKGVGVYFYQNQNTGSFFKKKLGSLKPIKNHPLLLWHKAAILPV